MNDLRERSVLCDNTVAAGDKTLEHVVLSAGGARRGARDRDPARRPGSGHLHRGSFIAINVSNIGRALPSLAVISIGLGLLGVGFTT